MHKALRFSPLVFFLSLVSSVGLAQVVKPPPRDPGFPYEDFNHNGVFDEGVDLKIDLPANYTPRTPTNNVVSIWASDAASEAGADLVFPPSVRRLDAGPTWNSNVFIYGTGRIVILRGVVVRADIINVHGDQGVTLEYCTLNGGQYVGVEGALHATAVTIHAYYVITYGGDLTQIDRSRIVGDSYAILTSDSGRMELTRTTVRGDTGINLRGELHGDAVVLASPEITIEQGAETAGGPLILTRSSINLGQGGTLSMTTSWFDAAMPIDLSKSVITAPYGHLDFYGSPCTMDPKAVRGPSPVISIKP
jgi:hypothetical protein